MSTEINDNQVPVQEPTKQQEEEPQQTEQAQEQTIPLAEFTQQIPLHHNPNDHIVPEEVEGDWELSVPSGFVTSLPNDPTWPVTERLIYNFTEAECARWTEVKHRVHEQQRQLPGLKDAPRNAMVLGANTFVGAKLIEMLASRGASRIVAVDSEEFAAGKDDFGGIVQYCGGRAALSDWTVLTPLMNSIDVIFDLRSGLCPFKYSKAHYDRLLLQGTSSILKLAEECGIKKFIFLSTPSARIKKTTPQLTNVTEFQLPVPTFEESYNDYFQALVTAEQLVIQANCETLMTTIISPSQIYGQELPREIAGDFFLLPQLLLGAQKGDLRVLGHGDNTIDICHVNNACHALILASAKLGAFDIAPAGNFYLITDDLPHYYWGLVDDLIVRGGLESLKTKVKAPSGIVKVGAFLTKALFPTSALNPYTAATSQLNRTFNIDSAKQILGYVPVAFFKDEWIKVCKAILEDAQLPCYNTRYYYEGTQFEGWSAEVAKAEAEKEQERSRVEAEEAQKREAERQARIEAGEEEPEQQPEVNSEESKKSKKSPLQALDDWAGRITGVLFRSGSTDPQKAQTREPQSDDEETNAVAGEVVQPEEQEEEEAELIQAPVVEEAVPVVEEPVPVVHEDVPVVEDDAPVEAEEAPVDETDQQPEQQQGKKKGKKGKK